MSSDKSFSHVACLVPSERVKFMIFVLKEKYMSTRKAIFTFKWTRCELKLDHRKFNFTNHTETKWLLRDKISATSNSNFKQPFYRSSGFDDTLFLYKNV